MSVFPRLIPVLTIDGESLVKTTGFKNPKYLGDPVNAMKIFSEMGADECIIVDISKDRFNRELNFDLIIQMADEAFMPITYGGGIRNVEQIDVLIRNGVDKVALNSGVSLFDANFVVEAIKRFGSQAIVGAIDVKKNILGAYETRILSGSKKLGKTISEQVKFFSKLGVGELFVNDISRDGSMKGFDLALLEQFNNEDVPVIFCGGAGTLADFSKIIEMGVQGAAGSSVFVFHGIHKGILISYPNAKQREEMGMK